MKSYLLILLILLLGCNPHNQSKEVQSNHVVDTIYDLSQRGTPYYQTLAIEVTDSTGLKYPTFRIGESTAVKFRVLEFEEYPLFVKGNENVIIEKGDSLSGVYYLIPIDSTFKIQLSQNYGIGNVVIKKNRDGETLLLESNGYSLVGSRIFKVE